MATTIGPGLFEKPIALLGRSSVKPYVCWCSLNAPDGNIGACTASARVRRGEGSRAHEGGEGRRTVTDTPIFSCWYTLSNHITMGVYYVQVGPAARGPPADPSTKVALL